MEATSKNKQFGISYYTDASGIRGHPFTFAIFCKSVLCGKVDTVKGVSVQPDWPLSGFNLSFMEFVRFIAEQDTLNEKGEWR